MDIKTNQDKSIEEPDDRQSSQDGKTPSEFGMNNPGAREFDLSSSVPSMPELGWPRAGYYHTIDSALVNLFSIGIRPERITIKKGGRGWNKKRVFQQDPTSETTLTGDINIELKVEGDGLFHSLPTGMLELGPDSEFEPWIRDLVSIFDDPIEKAAYFVRQGALYFDVTPENKESCARWIQLFGINPKDWSDTSLYKLAILLPKLHVVAGREFGQKLAIKLLLDLNVESIRWRPNYTLLNTEFTSRLGERASSLGVDLILGNGLENEGNLEITLGPVTLSVFRKHRSSSGERRLHQVLHLVIPYHLDYSVNWVVGDVNRAPCLGIDEQNSVLGVNTHLGKR